MAKSIDAVIAALRIVLEHAEAQEEWDKLRCYCRQSVDRHAA